MIDETVPATDDDGYHTGIELARREGILVGAIRPPTVPEGAARLRVTLSAAHTAEQVEVLLSVLGEIVAGEGA